MISTKRKRYGFLNGPNREVTDCDTPPTKHPKTSLQLTSSSINKANPRGQKRRKRPSIVYKSKRSRSKSSKSDGVKQAPIEEGSKLMVTPKDKKTNPLGSCKPSSLLNTDVLVSSLCEDKGSENSDTKNLSSPSLVCPSSLILKTPTYSMYTPSKSSLKMRTRTRSYLTPKVSFERYVTVAEFSPDKSTTTEEGECSDEQDSMDDLLSLAIKHHSKQ